MSNVNQLPKFVALVSTTESNAERKGALRKKSD